jgi:hypothetical protein
MEEYEVFTPTNFHMYALKMKAKMKTFVEEYQEADLLQRRVTWEKYEHKDEESSSTRTACSNCR